jgi:hypothetical protein
MACGRTFSDLTGTPLAYLKRLGSWLAFCDCMLATFPVRRTAAALRVHASTAFRWRHRLLDALRAADSATMEGDTTMKGDVSIAETWFIRSEKGCRELKRPARRRGEMTGWAVEREWVLLAQDHAAHPFGAVVGPRRPRVQELARALEGRLQRGITLACVSGPMGAVARFARLNGFDYRRLTGRSLLSNPAAVYGRNLRRWLRRFNGVATKYLPNYLLWHRFLDAAATADSVHTTARDRLVACAFP